MSIADRRADEEVDTHWTVRRPKKIKEELEWLEKLRNGARKKIAEPGRSFSHRTMFAYGMSSTYSHLPSYKTPLPCFFLIWT